MTYKGKRMVAVWILWIIATILSAALPTVSGHCETLRFVWLADSRGDTLHEPVNKPVLNAIIAQIRALSPPPAFVVFGGDMSYRGYINGAYTFKAWKDLFEPLTSAGIALYTVIGNHELYYEHSANGFLLGNQKEFQKVFSENPANGPSPDYHRLVYSFESPGADAFFAVLDPYYLVRSVTNPDLSGNIDDTQLKWLEDQVAKTKATHKFLFIHTPYYYVSGPDPSESPSSANVTFTKLWSILDKNRFVFYACGHSHLYSRKAIDSSIAPNPQTDPPRPPWKHNVVQLLNGTSGAGHGGGTITVDRALWHVFNAVDTYYFSVIDINDSIVTVTSYGGQAAPYQVIDRFPINIIPNTSLLLLD